MNKYMRMIIVVAILSVTTSYTIIVSMFDTMTSSMVLAYIVAVIMIGFVVFISYKLHGIIDEIESGK